MAPQFTAMNGLSQRALHSCTARAASSLPVPDSPNTTTQSSVAPAREMSSNTSRMGGESPTMLLKQRALRRSRSSSFSLRMPSSFFCFP